MEPTSFSLWPSLDGAVHRDGLQWVADMDAWRLGSTARATCSLDLATCLESPLESSLLPQARHVSGTF